MPKLIALARRREASSAEPKISWSLPQKGKATQYAVTLLRWTNLELAKIAMVPEALEPVAILVVPGDVTSIAVPPGLLVKGDYYVAVIDSVHAGDNDLKLGDRAAAPYRTPQPYAQASAVTSTFRITN